MASFQISNSHSLQHTKKYDDITFQKRCRLIKLIQEQKWTIRAAAQELGIKLCTAKHILYLYRKKGKIYKKKGQTEGDENSDERQNQNEAQNCFPVFFFAYPVYVKQQRQSQKILGQNICQKQKCDQDCQTQFLQHYDTQLIRFHQYGAFKPCVI